MIQYMFARLFTLICSFLQSLPFLGRISSSVPFLRNIVNHLPKVQETADNFVHDYKKGEQDVRKSKYTDVTKMFYNMITDFYEYGWGQSFHYSPRFKGESFDAGIARYEHWFALKLNLKPGMKIVDIGSGIGGPMRSIARFSGAHITGVNITPEHIRRAKEYNARDGIQNCSFIEADFNNIPVPDNHFEAGYDFEATLHSTNRLRTFKEIYRVLKPGALFISAQYVLLDNYDEKNPKHVDIIERVDNSNGCYVAPNTAESTRKAFKAAGFEIIEDKDVFAPENGNEIPFHEAFTNNSLSGSRFAGTTMGLYATWMMCWVAEKLRILPKGTAAVQEVLMDAATSFKAAGELGLLTPGWVFFVRKPAQN